MSILVTRPSPAGEQLVNQLRASGKSAWHLPLIHFLPGIDLPMLAERLTALSHDDLLFIVSQHAIDYAHSWLLQQGITWPVRLRYFAIGRTSGLRLRSLSGLPVIYPHTHQYETSEGLLSLPSLARIDGRRALVLRGNRGRELLKRTLLQRGVQVEYCECYRRYPITYDGEEQGRRLLSLGIKTLIMTSGEMLQQFYTLMPEYCHNYWLMRCQLIVVSERLAILAHQLGWKNIVVANVADNDALMRVLL
ncbi:uroporphyrinogen-III synthase [Candidatus Palibaumannia cicadellinicola]|uniref:Uroporphyrinogen-III synthase n=1 Tax=Candidatus Palibaumannia cicadellinicola TaxID=186490 RepID=A0A2N4XWH5_9GAMM|nr:uroporphyrinogen-III synthase [Candidatus Baumannia cicadellinicola]PLK58380.1 uroporphyrinogen-III synthase [Candidatus Baumannia cicadellinicola]